MKRLLLFVCLVGAAVYLLTPQNKPPEGALKADLAVQSHADHRGRPLSSSWASSLQSLRKQREVTPASSQQPVYSELTDSVLRPHNDKQGSQPIRGAQTPVQADQALVTIADDTEQDAVKWIKMINAVKLRSEPSVSSPGFRFYPAGSKAQVVGRANGWVQLLDPTTQERGWVYHSYLASIDAPSAAQLEAASKSPPVKVVSPRSRKPTVAAKPAPRSSDATKVTEAKPRLSRKARRAERRRGLGKRRNAQAWSIGPTQ